MNILIVCNHFMVASGRYMADAFTRLGHTVKHVGKPMGREIWGLTLPERYVWESIGHGFDQQFPPDLIVVMDSDPAILDWEVFGTFRWAWGNRTPPIVCCGVDNHVRDYRRPYINHYFLAHRNVSVMEWRDDMTWLPCASDPTIFTPSTIPYAEREYDVCMIGVMYPQRWEVVNRLRAAGLKVLAGTGLVYESMAAAYQNSRISLCLSAAGDVGQRLFETAACGCVVVSDKCADYALLQPPGVWIIENDPVEEIKGILADPTTAQRMAALSTAWALNGNRWDDRARVIVEWWEREHAKTDA